MTTNPHKRRDMDIMKLMMSDYVVDMEGNGSEFVVEFHGPKDSLYEGGLWQVHVTLPRDYPYHSPSIGFKNRLFHPNVDEMSGSVCLDVINQTWSPMYELVNIFDMFLPQLLSYPNASDPLNSEAAALMMQTTKSTLKGSKIMFGSLLKSRPPFPQSRRTGTQAQIPRLHRPPFQLFVVMALLARSLLKHHQQPCYRKPLTPWRKTTKHSLPQCSMPLSLMTMMMISVVLVTEMMMTTRTLFWIFNHHS